MGRRYRAEHEEEEESFFVSMTDIMVGLLFIFILIIMFFAVQSRLDSEKIKYWKDIVVESEKGNLKRRNLDRYLVGVGEQRADLLRWIKSLLIDQGIESVEIDVENGILRLPEGVLFKSGGYEIESSSPAEYAAKTLSAALLEVLPCSVMTNTGVPYRAYNKCKNVSFGNSRLAYIEAIFLEGHTDNIPIKKGLIGAPLLSSNLKLSARRASNTFEEIIFHQPELIEFYAPISSGNEPILAVSAYGETRPIGPNTTTRGRAVNRRIDLRILMHKPQSTDAYDKLLEDVGVPLSGAQI